MSVFNNPNFISFSGEPITGRMPTKTVVYGPQMTGPQQAGVAHAYKLFCDAVNTSVGKYVVQNRVLADGTKVRMISNWGNDTVMVWPVGGDASEVYRGFVIDPTSSDEGVITFGEPAAPWGPTLMFYKAEDSKWKRWVRPYRPGKDKSTPRYFVDDRKVTKTDRRILSDQPYADVYTLHADRLYRNGQSYAKAPGVDGKTPTVVHFDRRNAPDAHFYLSNEGVQYIQNETVPFLWHRGAELEVIVNGFQPAIGFRYSAETRTARYMVLNLTPSNVLQKWSAEVILGTDRSGASPLDHGADKSFEQIGKWGDMYSADGYEVTYSIPGSPMFDVPFNDAAIVAQQYPALAAGEFVNTAGTPVYASDVGAKDTVGVYTFSHIYSDTPVNAAMFPDQVAIGVRQVSVNATFKSGLIPWFNKWPGPRLWNAQSTPSEEEVGAYGGKHMASDLQNPPIEPGDLIQPRTIESGGDLTQLDTASAVLEIGGTPEPIFKMESTHTIQHKQGTSVDLVPGSPTVYTISSTYYIHKAYYAEGLYDIEYRATGWPVYNTYAWTKSNGPTRLHMDRTEQLTINATARDYIYADPENEVFVYIESTLAGVTTSVTDTWGGAAASTHSVTITLKPKLEFGETVVVGDEISYTTSETGVTANMVFPDGINFGTSDFVWQYVSPEVPLPMYHPVWGNQGDCPHIAHTTKAEKEAVTSANQGAPFLEKLLASFKFQVIFNGVLEPWWDEIPGATPVYLSMFEQMMSLHFSGIWIGFISDLPTRPILLNHTSPGGNVHADLGIKGKNPKSEFYRT